MESVGLIKVPDKIETCRSREFQDGETSRYCGLGESLICAHKISLPDVVDTGSEPQLVAGCQQLAIRECPRGAWPDCAHDLPGQS
jgi:hypothetical protein